MGSLIITVRARPNASKTEVGGAYGEPAQLVVRVTAPAVDGRANDAVRRAVADVFALATSCVSIIGGHSSRTKRLALDGDTEALQATLETLLGLSADSAEAPEPTLFD